LGLGRHKIEQSKASKYFGGRGFPCTIARLRGCAVARLRGCALNKRHQMFVVLSPVAFFTFGHKPAILSTKKLAKMKKKTGVVQAIAG
jgi:hypothetical protein